MIKIKSLIVTTGLLLMFLITYLYNYQLLGSDVPGCRPVRMGPSYARILGFDERFTKYASKYSLYLYREQGKDLKPTEENGFKLEGIPVLFIPGNAGSYKQVRSIASKASNIIANNDYDGDNKRIGKLDFFTADFNEDFTAFHGRTMLDQAEYLNEAIKFILNLYKEDDIPAKSILIVGHSMGGIVSRVMVTLPNYLDDSIKSIITLSTPHAMAALTFDRDIMRIYQAINDFWYQGLELRDNELSKTAYSKLKDISIVSIAGGLSDTIVPSDYTTLKSLVQPTNGFTVFTSGIPGVWTSIDHLAIVWCDQLRTVLLNLLLDMVDVTSTNKVHSLRRRIELSKGRLSTGFEDKSSINEGNFVNLKLDQSKTNIVSDPYFETKSGSISVFKNLGGSLRILGLTKPLEAIFLCNDHISTLNDMDLTTKETSEVLSFRCQDISRSLKMVPNNHGSESLKDSSIGDKLQPQYALILNDTTEYNEIIVVNYDAVVDVEKYEAIEVKGSFSHRINIPNNLVSTLHFPDIKSSLLAYDVKYNSPQNLLIRQSINEETKWHITNPIIANFHGNAPYLPRESSGLFLDIWKDQKTLEPIEVEILLNILVSVKLLLIRYRITILTYGLMVNLLVFVVQIFFYTKLSKAKFPKYLEALDKSLKYFVIFPFLNFLGRIKYVREILKIACLEYNEAYNTSFVVDLILVIISISINVLINFILENILKLNGYVQVPRLQNKMKYLVMGLISFLTMIYLPFQVLYVILVLVQILKMFKIKQESDLNFNVTILNLMIWILPINIPIIVVLIHNLTINWKTSFTSHHNILSVIPIMVLVNFKQTIKFRYPNLIIALLTYFIIYSYYYGAVNTFWLYQLFNYLCIALIISDNEWINRETKS